MLGIARVEGADHSALEAHRQGDRSGGGGREMVEYQFPWEQNYVCGEEV